MKTSFLACLFIAFALPGCGGGGDNAGVCSGSNEYCTEFATNSGSGSTAADATGGSATAAFSKSGTGNAVFDIPSSVKKIHIQGASTGTDTDFIVRIDGVLVVSAAIGPTKVPSSYDAEHLLFAGGTVQITQSSAVTWKFTEIP